MLFEVKELRVHYDKAEALKGISLTAEEGAIVALVGANGAGKTTLLQTISGLKRPTSGEIRFAGRRIDGAAPSQIVGLGIVQVPEGRHIFPDLTVMDNLRVGAYLRKDKEGVQKDLHEIFHYFPRLLERQRQRAGSMSGGEQQMLAIARALMARPKLLLLDEPSVGLSPLLAQEVGEIVASISERGISVILVEQNVALALRLARRGYVIETGRIVLEGTGKDLLANEEVRKAYLGG
jgi:branched-chain amino acid transport system ATP-binding protein